MGKKYRLTYFLIIAVLVVGCVLVYRTLTFPQGRIPLNGNLASSSFRGTYQLENGPQLPLEGKLQVPRNTKQLTLRGNFSVLPGAEQSFFFKTANLNIRVQVNHKTSWDFQQELPSDMYFTGNDYFRSWKPSEKITGKEEVVITLVNKSSDLSQPLFNTFLQNIYVGDSMALYAYLLQNNFWTLVLGGVAIASGLVTGFIRMGLTKMETRLKDRLSLYSILAIGAGFWGIRNNDISRLLFVPYPFFNRLISSISVATFFAFLILYIRFYLEKQQSRRALLGIVNCYVAGCLAILLGHFFPQPIWGMDAQGLWLLSAVALISTLGWCFYEWLQTRDKNTGGILLLLTPVVVGVSVDAYNLLRGELYYFDSLFVTDGILLIFLLVQLGILSMHINDAYQRLKAMNALETELHQNRIAIMLSQIQPHFLYNALASIRYLCGEEPAKAEDAIVHFSRYLRGNMESLSQKTTIPFSKELEHLENYLVIEKLRFGDKIKISYALQEKDFFLPALTLQPLVENAIHHGLQPKREGGTIVLSTYKEKGCYIVKIADDGMGFDTNQALSKGKNHIGLSNTRARVQSMCRGTVEVYSAPGKGTKVLISIPYEYVKSL